MHELIRHLRNGKQAPIDLVLTNERLPENVAAKAARFIEPDSVAILNFLQKDPLIGELGYTRETLMSMFIPNTYEFFWNTTPRGFVERMHKEHERFWDANNRRQKAEKLDLTPAEVYTLLPLWKRKPAQ